MLYKETPMCLNRGRPRGTWEDVSGLGQRIIHLLILAIWLGQQGEELLWGIVDRMEWIEVFD